jgi:hypothetical protein
MIANKLQLRRNAIVEAGERFYTAAYEKNFI